MKGLEVRLLPSSKQFKKWSVPSKVSYLAFWLSVLSTGVGSAHYFLNRVEGWTDLSSRLERRLTSKDLGYFPERVKFATRIEIGAKGTIFQQLMQRAGLKKNPIAQHLEYEYSKKKVTFDVSSAVDKRISDNELVGDYYFLFPVNHQLDCNRHTLAALSISDTLNRYMRRPIQLIAVNIVVHSDEAQSDAKQFADKWGYGDHLVHATAENSEVLEQLDALAMLYSRTKLSEITFSDRALEILGADNIDSEKPSELHVIGGELTQTAALINPQGYVEGYIFMGHDQTALKLSNFSEQLFANIVYANPQLLILDQTRLSEMQRMNKRQLIKSAKLFQPPEVSDESLEFADHPLNCSHG